MLPPGLRLLLRLRTRAFTRKTWRALRKPRTALPLVLMYGNVLFVFTMFSLGRWATSGESSFYDLITPELVALPLSVFFLLALTGVLFEFPLAFTSSEIQWLYSGPYSRRSLMVYKLTSYVPIALFGGFFGATMTQGGSRQWFLAFPALSVFAAFMLLSTVALGLLARMRGVKVVVLGVLAAAAIGAGAELLPLTRGDMLIASMDAWLEALRPTYTFKALVAMTLPFGRMAVNGFDPQWLLDFGFTVLISAAMFAVVLRLDVNFYEDSLRATARREARLERMQRGRISRGAWSGARRLRLPMLPHWGGAGPTIHRHSLAMVRDRSALWLLACVIGLPLIAALVLQWMEISDAKDFRRIGIGMSMYVAFFATSMLRFDFRSDYAVLDYLKVLPTNPFALAAGTVLVPCMFALAIQYMPPAVFSVATGTRMLSPLWLLFLVPVNVMWFALDNAFYLRAPTPIVRGLQANPTALSQGLLAMFGIMVTLSLVGACATGIYFLTRFATGSTLIAQLAAAAFLWPCAGGAVFFTGRAFRDLDLGRDRL